MSIQKKGALLASTSSLRFFSRPGDHGVSCVSAVVDRYGGVRVIITKPDRIAHHLGADEIAYTVPDYFVWEPVPWGLTHWIIRVAYRHLARATNCFYKSPFSEDDNYSQQSAHLPEQAGR
jgi:hypothetical protein